MRRIIFQLVATLLSLALTSGAHASGTSQTLVREGRNLAFNGGSPTLQGLRDADSRFQEALSRDSYDQEAHFFRAITRVLVSVADQAEGIGMNTIRHITRAFNFSWKAYDTLLPPFLPTPDPSAAKTAFLQSLADSLSDLSTISDTFSVTLMSHQTDFDRIDITITHVQTLQDLLQTISSAVDSIQDWDLLSIEFITDPASGLPKDQRALLSTFLNPFGYYSLADVPIPRPDFDGDNDADGLELATCAAEMTPSLCDPEIPCQCDLDGSGAVNAIDLQLLLIDFPGGY